MNIEIKEKRDNVLLDRIDVKFIVTHDGEKTPTREALKKALATTLGAKPELTIIERVDSEFGRAVSPGVARVYKTLEKARALENAYMQKRNGIYVEPKKREAPKKEA